MGALKLNIRPSNLDRVLSCPGAQQACATVPDQGDNEHTSMGKRRHDGMALIMRLGYEAASKRLAQNDDWTADDITVTAEAWGLAQHLFPSSMEIFVEETLNMEFMGISEGERRVDVLGVDLVNRRILVLDWKFGKSEVTDPEFNWQVKSYAAAAAAKYPGQVDTAELVIIQPLAWKVDDRRRSATVTVDQLRADASFIKAGVAAAKVEGAPRIPGGGCKWCTFADHCPEKKGADKMVVAAKAEARRDEVAKGTPILVNYQEGQDISLPLVVISQELVDRVDALVARALAIKVVDQATAEEAGRVSKEIRGLNKLVDDNRKEVKAPLLFYTKAIDEAPKAVTKKMTDADNYLQAEVTALMAAEAKRAAEAEALRRKQEEAQAKAEEERLKAERARKPETKAAAEAKAAEAQEQAAALQQQLVPMVQQPAPVLKVAGFAAVPTVALTIHDIGKVPEVWARQILVVDEKKVADLLKKGLLNEAAVLGWGTIVRGTTAGRK